MSDDLLEGASIWASTDPCQMPRRHCGGGCSRGRIYRVAALARAHGDRTVGDVLNRFRCTACGAGAVTAVLAETFERRRVPLLGGECQY